MLKPLFCLITFAFMYAIQSLADSATITCPKGLYKSSIHGTKYCANQFKIPRAGTSDAIFKETACRLAALDKCHSLKPGDPKAEAQFPKAPSPSKERRGGTQTKARPQRRETRYKASDKKVFCSKGIYPMERGQTPKYCEKNFSVNLLKIEEDLGSEMEEMEDGLSTRSGRRAQARMQRLKRKAEKANKRVIMRSEAKTKCRDARSGDPRKPGTAQLTPFREESKVTTVAATAPKEDKPRPKPKPKAKAKAKGCRTSSETS